MNVMIRVLLATAAWIGVPISIGVADDVKHITLDPVARDQCLKVLSNGLRTGEFWPSIHAAEGLTLAGQGKEVIEFLTPKLSTEKDDQKRCGIAREIARAGDRSAVKVILGILSGDAPHGHVHAAESLFKLSEIGDGKSITAAFKQNDNLTLKLMAAGALARRSDEDAMKTIREFLGHEKLEHAAIAAWILGQIGDRSDIPLLKAQLSRLKNATPRANFEHALAILGDDEGLAALQRNLSSNDNLIRTYAATFAGDARVISAEARLKAMLTDPFPDARIRTAQSLLVLSKPATPIVPAK